MADLREISSRLAPWHYAKTLFFFFLVNGQPVHTDQRPFFVRRATVMTAKTLQFKNQTTS